MLYPLAATSRNSARLPAAQSNASPQAMPPTRDALEHTPSAGWNSLPPDVLINIAGYLPTRDLRIMARTNTDGQALAEDPHVIAKLDYKETHRSLWGFFDNDQRDTLKNVLNLDFPNVRRWVDTQRVPDAPIPYRSRDPLATPEGLDPNTSTPLEIAYANDDVDAFKLFAGMKPLDATVARRMKFIDHIIEEKDQVALRQLLASLPPKVKTEHHESLIRALAEAGHSPSIRDFLRGAGDDKFAILSDGSSTLHLGLWETALDVNRLVQSPGGKAALHIVDEQGRTPLMAAAQRGDLIGLCGLTLGYEGQVTDTLNELGPIEHTLQSNPIAAAKLMKDPAMAERFTIQDKRATLAAALVQLVNSDFVPLNEDDGGANTFSGLYFTVRSLLSLPAGQIDVNRVIDNIDYEGDYSILQILQDGLVAEALQDRRKIDKRDFEDEVENFDSRIEFDNGELLRHAQRHLAAEALNI